MSTILVVDDQSFSRELICDVLTSRGYECVAAADGSSAWPILQAGNVGLVICDMVMPIVDGLRLLREMRGDERLRALPVIVLTAVLERASIVEAKTLGVRDYLLKNSFSLPDLIARVERHFGSQKKVIAGAAATPNNTAAPAAPGDAPAKPAKPTGPNVHLPRLLERDPLAAAAAEIDTLRTLPGAVAEVARLAELGEGGATELGRAVRHDPVLAARAIRRAAAGGDRIVSIEDAVRRLGPAAMKELAAAPAPFAAFPLGKADGPEMLRCWEHRFAVATLMDRVVPRSDTIGGGVAYATGLLHDLGELLLRQRFGDAFRAAQQFAAQAGQPLGAVQATVLGMSPGDLAVAMLSAINAPQLIVDAVTRYWTPPLRSGATPDAADTLAAGLRLANDFAAALQLGPASEARIGPVTKAAHRAAMLAPADVRAAEVRAEALMIVASAAGPAAIAPQSAAPRDIALAYVRHATFAPIDPLEAALGQLAAEVQLSATLPAAPQLAAAAAVVVAVPNLRTAGFTPADFEHARRAGARPELPVLFVTTDPNDAEVALGAGMRLARSPVAVREVAKFVAAC